MLPYEESLTRPANTLLGSQSQCSSTVRPPQTPRFSPSSPVSSPQLSSSLPQQALHYNLGAHFLWIGDRTRQLDGAHVEYFRGIANPIGVKIGPDCQPGEIAQLVELLDPDCTPGRLTLITRFGAGQAAAMLPRIVAEVQGTRRLVVWQCDPMHGNTIALPDGSKTRRFDAIVAELRETAAVHHACGSWLGGVHFELTGDDVTECVGGLSGVEVEHVLTGYRSYCDPRLNNEQSIELAIELAHLLTGT